MKTPLLPVLALCTAMAGFGLARADSDDTTVTKSKTTTTVEFAPSDDVLRRGPDPLDP